MREKARMRAIESARKRDRGRDICTGTDAGTETNIEIDKDAGTGTDTDKL